MGQFDDPNARGVAFANDAALVQACLAGEERAWEELVDRYGRLVYSIPRRMGLSPEDADDVFQNVFSTLLRRMGSLRDQSLLAAWLITTTKRECWRLQRAGKGHDPLTDVVPDTSPALDDDVVRLEREQVVWQAMRQLDDRCRHLLTALFLDPAAPGYDAVAARLDMPVGSIGPTRARCFRKLDTILHEIGVGDDW